MTDAYTIRPQVGKWLRIKANQPDDAGDFKVLRGKAYYPLRHALEVNLPQLEGGVLHVMCEETADKIVRSLLEQLSADADHSDLLVRLLNGEEPR